MMKRLLLSLGFLVVLLAAPSLFACERCAIGGKADAGTGGSIAPWTRCLFDCAAGTLNLCKVNDDNSGCTDQDPGGTDCATCGDTGRGGGTGGSGGSSGSTSCTTSSGACPPSCMSCSSGLGNLY
jgi:hypothetical protein